MTSLWPASFAALFCLSAGALAEAPPSRYSFERAGVVYDLRTKLSWQREVPASYSPTCASGIGCTLEEAVRYCRDLTAGGTTGWRLPTRAELLSIVDRTEFDPAIDRQAFPSTPSTSFWSSSPQAGSQGAVWCVDFYYGESRCDGAGVTSRVRCVR